MQFFWKLSLNFSEIYERKNMLESCENITFFIFFKGKPSPLHFLNM